MTLHAPINSSCAAVVSVLVPNQLLLAEICHQLRSYGNSVGCAAFPSTLYLPYGGRTPDYWVGDLSMESAIRTAT